MDQTIFFLSVILHGLSLSVLILTVLQYAFLHKHRRKLLESLVSTHAKHGIRERNFLIVLYCSSTIILTILSFGIFL